MKREIIGLTHFSCVLDVLIFGGFIAANEFNIRNLIQAYELFFLLHHCALCIGGFYWFSRP